MYHGHMSLQVDFLYEQAITDFAFELSSFIAAFVFTMPVDVALVSVHSSTFIKTFVSELKIVEVSKSFTKISTLMLINRK